MAEPDIFDEFKSNRSTPVAPPIQSAQKQSLPLGRSESRTPGLIPSFKQGASDVINTVASGIGAIDEGVERLFKVKTGGTQRNQNFQNRLNVENKNFEQNYGDMRGSDIGRAAGQMAVTAPIIPGGLISQGAKTIFGALPTVLSTGEKIAAPLGRRLLASSATGGVAGGMFGGLTSAGSDDPLAEHVGKNILGGMVGGPIVEGAGTLASKVAPALKSTYYNTKLNYFTNKYGITPQSAKNVLAALENEGMTLADAEAKLVKFGAEGTIGDLTPALQQFVGALGKRGEITSRAASITKNRYAARADTADDRIVNDVIAKLGPRKDVSLERGKIVGQAADDINKAAQAATSGDYNAAKLNPTKLSVYSLIGEINSNLESAAGAKETALKEAKGYLYKTVKDPATGADVQQVRSSVKDLHESRIALDDLIEKRGDALPPRALSAVKDVRAKVDAQLKTIPEMKAADEKFSKAMNVKEGLKIGYEALKKGNRFSFDRAYDGAPSEVQQTIREGMLANIYDYIDQAAKGELSGASQLFADRALTRHKLVKAFGVKGEEALEALEKHIVMRATERYASTGSITNAAERINSALDMQGSPKGPFKEAAKGAILDAFAGTPGYIAGLRGAGAAGSNIVSKVAAKRHDLNVESLADLVSRSGPDRDLGMTFLKKVDSVQKKIAAPHREIKLPVVLSAPIGEPIYESGKTGAKIGKNIGKHWINQLSSFID